LGVLPNGYRHRLHRAKTEMICSRADSCLSDKNSLTKISKEPMVGK
jgi:hypothetical protein